MIEQNPLPFWRYSSPFGEKRRMTLSEFRAFALQQVDTIVAMQQELEDTDVLMHSQKSLLSFTDAITRLGEGLEYFQQNIQSSTYLPLSVVPGTLRLIIPLTKAICLIPYIRQVATRMPLGNIDFHSLEYQELHSELAKLKKLCEQVAVQTNLLLDYAQLGELKGSSVGNHYPARSYNTSSREQVKNVESAKIIHLSDFLSSSS